MKRVLSLAALIITVLSFNIFAQADTLRAYREGGINATKGGLAEITFPLDYRTDPVNDPATIYAEYPTTNLIDFEVWIGTSSNPDPDAGSPTGERAKLYSMIWDGSDTKIVIALPNSSFVGSTTYIRVRNVYMNYNREFSASVNNYSAGTARPFFLVDASNNVGGFQLFKNAFGGIPASGTAFGGSTANIEEPLVVTVPVHGYDTASTTGQIECNVGGTTITLNNASLKFFTMADFPGVVFVSFKVPASLRPTSSTSTLNLRVRQTSSGTWSTQRSVTIGF